MDKVKSVEQLLEGAGAIRGLRNGYISNFFFDMAKHSLWTTKGDCLCKRIGNTFFILKENPGFMNVFFCSTDPESLRMDLRELEGETKGKTLVIDVVGKGDEVSGLGTGLAETGYRNVCNLCRMSRQTQEMPDDADFNKVEYAIPEMASQILGFLEKYFDKELEQLPYLEEITELIQNNGVLVYLDGDKIAGFVIYEKNKTTLYLRYWFVRPEYRDKKIGGLLLRRFFNIGNDTRRQMLWVVKSNENSLKRYIHYGFSEDGLQDRIFIKGDFRPNILTTNNLNGGG